jgi:hypothetical protein
MLEDWRGSAHARSTQSPLYLAMRRHGGDGCERCHAPLSQHDTTGQLAREGVGCEGCHLIHDAEAARAGGVYAANHKDNVMYASICDAKNHYFHKMGCSPFHEEARFCGACHLMYRPLASGESIPVYTEYEEWAAGPAAAEGMDCQVCHMPSETVAVAEGEAARAGVGHHGLLGLSGRLRGRALTLAAAVSGRERLRVAVTLTNSGAGHRVPTGSPERRLILRARTVDADGREVARGERRYGRRLVDAEGRPSPFWSAVRVAVDDRLAPRESREEIFELVAPSKGEVRVEAVWLAADPEVVAGLTEVVPAQEVMAEVRVPFGAPRGAGREGLPARAEMDPVDRP